MINESRGQTSSSVRLSDEDRVYDVQGIVLQTSCPRNWSTFPLESAESDWRSLDPAQQHLYCEKLQPGEFRSLVRLHSRCPPGQAGRSRTRSADSREARSGSRRCCSAQTAAIAPAWSLQFSNHSTQPELQQKVIDVSLVVRWCDLALENLRDGQPAEIGRLNSRTILTSLADQTLQPPLVSLVSVIKTGNIPYLILATRYTS